MPRRSHRAHRRLAGALATLVGLLGFLTCPGFATAQTAAQVAHYWTPARMHAARPLDLVIDAKGRSRLRVGAAGVSGGAAVSFVGVPTPALAPFSFNGRVFIRRGGLSGYCSGTAIDSPTRQLVLTAGHCLNSGREGGGGSVWSDYLEFVPAYEGGRAPFGAFVARRDKVRAPRQWTNHGNPDFDLGAFLTRPNLEGLNVADAVGGGATIVTDLSRHQRFQTFGYPGETKFMKRCDSPYVGDDRLSYLLPGPPTLGIRCHWVPGASGGGWMIGDGFEINGVSTYLRLESRSHTYSPYFSAENVGKLVQGL
jgi:hypothetical protein